VQKAFLPKLASEFFETIPGIAKKGLTVLLVGM